MGGFVTVLLISSIWIVAVFPAGYSSVATCTKEAPICSSTLYPLCVYSEDCKPDWQCVSLSNLLQSIYTKFRCEKPPPQSPETVPCTHPTNIKPRNGESDTGAASYPSNDHSEIKYSPEKNRNSIDKSNAELSQDDFTEESVMEPHRSTEDTVKESEPSNDVKPSSIKPAASAIETPITTKSNPGNIIKDVMLKELVGLELEQLFNGDIIPKFTLFSRNKTNSDKYGMFGSGPMQIDWTGLGSIDPLPSGQSRSRQLKLPAPESKPDLKQLDINVANKPNALGGIRSAESDSPELENSPMELDDLRKPTGSQKPNDSAKSGLPPTPTSMSNGKKGTGAIVGPKFPGNKADHDHQLDSNTDMEPTPSQENPVSIHENESQEFRDDVEDLSKTSSEMTDFESSESQELNSHNAGYKAASKDSSRPSLDIQQVKKPGGLVKSMSSSQIERAPEPNLPPITRAPSKAIVAHDSESLSHDSKGKGNSDLENPLPEVPKTIPIEQNEPKTTKTINQSQNQKKKGSSVGPLSIQESDELSKPKPLLQPVQDSSELLNLEPHKYPEAVSVGSETVPPKPDTPVRMSTMPRAGSSNKGRNYSHGSNRNTKYG